MITGGFCVLCLRGSRTTSPISIVDVEAKPAHAQQLDGRTFAVYGATTALEHFVDRNYDNYNLEATYAGQLIDICPMERSRIAMEERPNTFDSMARDFRGQ